METHRLSDTRTSSAVRGAEFYKKGLNKPDWFSLNYVSKGAEHSDGNRKRNDHKEAFPVVLSKLGHLYPSVVDEIDR